MIVNEQKKRTREDLLEGTALLKEWLLKQPHLPHDIDDDMLMGFVNGTKTLTRAKEKLDNYYTMRGKYPDLFSFSARDPLSEKSQKAAQAMEVFLLPGQTPEGFVVGISKLNKEHVSNFNHKCYDAHLSMSLELCLSRTPDHHGAILIMDMEGTDASFFYKLNLTSTAMVDWFQHAFPIRFKRGILINAPKFIDRLCNFFLPLMKEKLRNRIVITEKGPEVLPEYVPLEMLPSDYGGPGKSCAAYNEEHIEMLIQHRDWFMKTSSQCSDESKRPPDEKETFGVKGTFRYLAID